MVNRLHCLWQVLESYVDLRLIADWSKVSPSSGFQDSAISVSTCTAVSRIQVPDCRDDSLVRLGVVPSCWNGNDWDFVLNWTISFRQCRIWEKVLFSIYGQVIDGHNDNTSVYWWLNSQVLNNKLVLTTGTIQYCTDKWDMKRKLHPQNRLNCNSITNHVSKLFSEDGFSYPTYPEALWLNNIVDTHWLFHWFLI